MVEMVNVILCTFYHNISNLENTENYEEENEVNLMILQSIKICSFPSTQKYSLYSINIVCLGSYYMKKLVFC